MSNVEMRVGNDGRPHIVVDGKVMFRCMGNGQTKLAKKMILAEKLLEALEIEFEDLKMREEASPDEPRYSTPGFLTRMNRMFMLIKKAKGETE